MFLKEVLFTYETMISIVVAVVAVSSVYLRIRLDMAKLELGREKLISEMNKHNDEIDLKINDIICDREKRWTKYEEKQDKQDAYQSDILKGVNEIRIKIAGMEKNIDWLKKN